MDTLQLRPGKTSRRRLRKRRSALRARLGIRVQAPGAPERVLRRSVRLKPARRRR